MIAEKPRKSFWQLFNLSFGFFGIQIGFALQNANMSRIFQSLGESLDNLPALWIAAPLTGLLVQPIVGHYSDRTWTRLGRRRPYFLAGAVLAALSLVVMPLSQSLLLAAMMLWILDASLNISMEPFRAFVGDNLRKDQHTMGYAIQTAFIGAGAVAGSLFPYLLTDMGVANTAPPGQVPDTVRISFWFGAAALFLAVLWTIVTTREYSPEEMRAFAEATPDAPEAQPIRALATRTLTSAIAWIAAGVVVVVLVGSFDLEKELYLLGGLLAGYGLASLIAIRMARAGRDNSLLGAIVGDFSGMPPIMKRLSLVQFFSWSSLFIMWIYTTPVVAQTAFGATDASSPAYNAAGNWVGVLFAIYNGIAAIAALTLLPWFAARIGKVRTHALCLLCGAAGFASFLFIRDAQLLIVSEIGIGIAWASILAMPYAILASSLPQAKLGIFMGLFNVFVVLPQLLVATVMGSLLKAFFPTEPVWTMAFAAAVLAMAALATLRVPEPDAAPM